MAAQTGDLRERPPCSLGAPLARSTLMQAAGILALAVVFRGWQIESLSLNHFDEGVLVSGAFGVWLHGLWHFPLAQPLQAPPLYPWMIAGAFGLTGTASPSIALYLSAVLGSATVGLYWVLLRRLRGPQFALMAAALFAASDLHIAFSRMALTDVPLTFWFVGGAYCLTRLTESVRSKPALHDGRRWGRGVVQNIPAVAWCLATGLAAGAAWTTKYNGWMWLAIAGTTWLIVTARGWLMKRSRTDIADEQQTNFSRPAVLLAIGVAALVSMGCFAPWYLYVERTLEGGYGAVTANHLRYFGGISAWPGRAARLWLSLAAFRHFGWITTLSGFGIGLAWLCSRHQRRVAKSRAELIGILLAGLTLLTSATALGSDAVVTALAAAAIVPALVWGGWPEVFFAVWAASFLIMTPFYHPYTRLLVPALPAEIALAAWLVTLALGRLKNERFSRVSERGAAPPRAVRSTNYRDAYACRSPASFLAVWSTLGLTCCGLFVAAIVWRPFGWIPSRGAWDRWSARQSYRGLGEAVRGADLPADAVVLCQGPPAMTLYLDREWAPLEFVPFQLWLPHVDRERDCYLAADFWGLYAENHQLAREAMSQRIGCLQPVAVVPNDLNLVTLLDYLPAAEVARHVSRPWPPKQLVAADGRDVVVPADLLERRADVIVLYRIDRDCVDLK